MTSQETALAELTHVLTDGRVPYMVIGGRFCTAEDLILMKIVSDRERDLADARAIIRRRRLPQLDREYLDPRIHELSQLLERPDIDARWRTWSMEPCSPRGVLFAFRHVLKSA